MSGGGSLACGAGPVVGVDFDNTIALYDELFRRVARERGLVEAPGPAGKAGIRDAIRARPDGERDWQRVQAEVYGPRMGQAEPMDGVREFLEACGRAGTAVYVVSHKTAFAECDETRTDLRQAALRWLEERALVADGGPLQPDRVFFEDTRAAKVARIGALGCTHFVDDLPEVFLDAGFPRGVAGLLLAPDGRAAPPGVRAVRSWAEVAALVDG